MTESRLGRYFCPKATPVAENAAVGLHKRGTQKGGGRDGQNVVSVEKICYQSRIY